MLHRFLCAYIGKISVIRVIALSMQSQQSKLNKDLQIMKSNSFGFSATPYVRHWTGWQALPTLPIIFIYRSSTTMAKTAVSLHHRHKCYTSPTIYCKINVRFVHRVNDTYPRHAYRKRDCEENKLALLIIIQPKTCPILSTRKPKTGRGAQIRPQQWQESVFPGRGRCQLATSSQLLSLPQHQPPALQL